MEEHPRSDPYAVLGVAATASIAEVRAAQRRLALQLHPDRHAGDPAARRDAERRMAEVNAAASLLTDPVRRARLDAGRAESSAMSPPTRSDDRIEVGGSAPTASLAGTLPWLVLAGVLFGIFVFTAFAGGPGGDDVAERSSADATDATVRVRDVRGSCVLVAGGFNLVVNCGTMPNEGVIVAIGSLDAECPDPTRGFAIPQEDLLACVEPVAG